LQKPKRLAFTGSLASLIRSNRTLASSWVRSDACFPLKPAVLFLSCYYYHSLQTPPTKSRTVMSFAARQRFVEVYRCVPPGRGLALVRLTKGENLGSFGPYEGILSNWTAASNKGRGEPPLRVPSPSIIPTTSTVLCHLNGEPGP